MQKNKLVIMTTLREQILRKSMFKSCEILIDSAILKMILTSFGMYDFGIILGMDWLSTHQASVDYFTMKVIFRNLGYPKLEFEGDQKVLLTCVILTLEAKRLLHKGCEAYLAHVVDKSSSEVTLDSMPVV